MTRPAGMPVIEVEQPRRADRRRRGKSDLIDAELAARYVLTLHPAQGNAPRADGDREALRILRTARDGMSTTHTAMINQLKALLRTGGDTDRDLARRALNKTVLLQLQHRTTTESSNHQRIYTAEIVRQATAIADLGRQLAANNRELADLVRAIRPALLTHNGIGPVTAATAICAWSHPGRCRNEAAFASLAGVNPVPASSGNTNRHRLNHGGDRTLNRAIHTIALTRWRTCPRTAQYIQRRRAEGKTDRDIRRCLKRYIARELFRALNTP